MTITMRDCAYATSISMLYAAAAVETPIVSRSRARIMHAMPCTFCLKHLKSETWGVSPVSSSFVQHYSSCE